MLARTQPGAAPPSGPDADLPAGASGAGPHDLGGPCPAPEGVSVGAAARGPRAQRPFNGKIDTPRLFAGPLTGTAVAALAADAPAARAGGLRHEWRFTPDAALPPHRVRDTGPGRRDGTLVNSPALGVTGRNWTPGTEGFPVRPGEYGAAHFHEDDLTDAGWPTSLSFEVPAGWPSGVYGIRLRAGEHEDMVPLIVSAAGRRAPAGRRPPAGYGPDRRPPAGHGVGHPAAAVLLPTFSYLAYANEHASWENPISATGDVPLIVTAQDRFMSDQRLLSLYERHTDGSGCCLSSWRRPVLNMRPGYHLPLVRGPHQFSADLELLYWLEHRQVEVDVITDDDLHTRGAAALEPVPGHPDRQPPGVHQHPDARRAGQLPGHRRAADVPGRQRVLLGHHGARRRPVSHRGPPRAGRHPGVGVRTRRMAPGHDGRARRAVAAPRPQPAVADRGRVHRPGFRRVTALPHRGQPGR